MRALRPADRAVASGAVSVPLTSATRGASRNWRRYRPRTFYTFVAPWLVGFLLLTAGPLAYAFVLSFTDYGGLSPSWDWIGLDNYRQALSDPQTWKSLLWTGLFMVVAVPATVALGLFLAVLLNQRIRARGGFRSMFYLPYVVPPVAAALTFRLLFDRDAGAVNGVLELFGLDATLWLTGASAFWVVIMLLLWTAGANMVISLAGLQGIPQELLEAARIDGAGPLRTFRHITLPLLSPVLFFQLITGVIVALQTFIPSLLLASSNPSQVAVVPEEIYFYMVHVYAQAFSAANLGYASALLWLLFLVIAAFTAVVFRIGGQTVFYAQRPDAPGKRGA